MPVTRLAAAQLCCSRVRLSAESFFRGASATANAPTERPQTKQLTEELTSSRSPTSMSFVCCACEDSQRATASAEYRCRPFPSCRASRRRRAGEFHRSPQHVHARTERKVSYRRSPCGFDPITELSDAYESFLSLNTEFKQVCTDWQVRDGKPNSHDMTTRTQHALRDFATCTCAQSR